MGPITETGVTAHRGFSGAYVQNTMPAFEEALRLDVDWVELDVWTTADGQLVVTHDGSTLALTGEEGVIGEITYEEIAALDTAVEHRERTGVSEERMPPQRMPLLRDVLAFVMEQDRVRASLQPKDDSTAAAIELIREMGAGPWVSFNDGSLEKMSLVKELAPELPVFWDRWSVSKADEHIAIALDQGFESLVYNEQVVTPEAIDAVHAAGLEFGVWTVNDSRKMREFAEMGVNRLYTDHPDLALPIMGHDAREGLMRGLLSYWPFDAMDGEATLPIEGSPNPLRDAVAHGGAEAAPEGVAGGFAEVPIEVMPDSVPALTISAWIRPEDVQGRQAVLLSTGAGTNTGGEAVELRLDGGSVAFSLATRGEHVAGVTEGEPVAAGEWHHVALTYDECTGRARVFVDGEPQEVSYSGFYETERATGELDDSDGLLIGASSSSPNRDDRFRGEIDEVALWRRALPDAEIGALWGNGSAAPIVMGQLR